MAHQCDGCGETFKALSALRLHDCPRPSADDGLTVLNDWTHDNEPSHQEIAAELLPRLREEMPEDEFRADYMWDLQSAVIGSITRDLSANLKSEDWLGMGFEEPTDFLDAGQVASAIGNQAEWYFKDDQTGKSNEIMQVIFEYAEEYELVERHQQPPDDSG